MNETSRKQAAANKANAALSTGPRTAEGKSASSKNATSHGLYATSAVVFHWESQAEFDQLRTDYLERFCPIDRLERDIVDRLLDSTWRRNRAISIETTILNLKIEKMAEEVSKKYLEPNVGLLRVALAFDKRHGDGAWDAIARHLTAADRAYQKAMRDLCLLQGNRFGQMQKTAQEKAEIVETTERTDSTPEPAEPASVGATYPASSTMKLENRKETDSNDQLDPRLAA